MDPEEEARIMRALEESARSGPVLDLPGSTPAPAPAARAALAESGRSAPVYDFLDEANRRAARQRDEEAIGPTRARAAREDAAIRALQQPPQLTYADLAEAARPPTRQEMRAEAVEQCRIMNAGRVSEGCVDNQYQQVYDNAMGIAPPPPGIGPDTSVSMQEAYGEDWDNIRTRMTLARHGRDTVPSPLAVANGRAINHLTRGGPAMTVGGAAMTASHVLTDSEITTERVNRIGAVAAPIDNMLGAAGDTAEARNTRHLPMSRTSTVIGANDGTAPDTWGPDPVMPTRLPLDGDPPLPRAEHHPRLVVDPQAAAAADADTADGLVNNILAEHRAGRGTR